VLLLSNSTQLQLSQNDCLITTAFLGLGVVYLKVFETRVLFWNKLEMEKMLKVWMTKLTLKISITNRFLQNAWCHEHLISVKVPY
jgi:hypothetical protein